MRAGLITLLVVVALVGAAWFAPILREDPGQVVIGVGPWLIEMPLLMWVAAIVLVWLLLWWVVGLLRWPGQVIAHRRRERSRSQLEEGFLALTEGDWDRAHGLFDRSLSYQKSTAGFLGAARAAQGLNDLQARDAWLAKADRRFGRKHFVTQLARARLMIDEGRLDAAIDVLEALHLKKSRHIGVLRLLLGAYQDSGRWRALRELTPALRKAGMVDQDKADALVQLAAKRELAQCMDESNLENTWKALSRSQRHDKALILTYAKRAKALGHHQRADKLLSALLDQGLDHEALALLRESNATQRATRIVDLEKRLKREPSHVELLEALGFLYLDDRQYDKAQSCLEKVVQHNNSAEVSMALGRLADRQGLSAEAARHYRNALQFHSGSSSQALLESDRSE